MNHPAGGHVNGALYSVFMVANVVIALGYLSIAIAGARFVRRATTRRSKLALVYTAGFFMGCVGTHLMTLTRGHVTPFWTAWHVVQAVCTWGAIILGRRIIIDAWRLWCRWAKGQERLINPAGGCDGGP